MPFDSEILLLVFTLAGITLKLADFYGEHGRCFVRYIIAVISAICMGLLISESAVSSSIVLGIIIGVVVAGKVDQLNLIIGLVATLTMAVVLGFNFPDFRLMFVIAIGSLVDEMGHDRFTSNGVVNGFFRFRLFLKTVVVILHILMLVDVTHALGFFCFDISYDLTDMFLLRKTKES